MILLFCLIFFTLLCIGLPIFYVLGITAIVMIGFHSNTPLLMIPEVMYNSLYSFPLMAIPFFVISAQFMLRGGTSKYLINAADTYVRHLRGGLAIVCVLSCMVFAAICGSSVATAMALGVVIIPAMAARGYPRYFATGVVASSGTMGIMIPPSVALILYGIIAEESIPRLFLAGFLPGMLEASLYIMWITYYSKKNNWMGGERASFSEMATATYKAIPAFAMPVIVLGGLYSGIVTVTEAASLAAVVAIVISLFIYQEVKITQLIPISAEAMKSAGMIMAIISTAIVFGNWITEAGIPARLVKIATDIELTPFMFLLFINFFLLFLGMFLEVVSIMLITLPVIMPVIRHLGIDPIHFGIIMTVNMEVALITPPVGLNLYVLSGVSGAPLSEVVRGAFPFVILGLIEIAIITYWPAYTLFLPNLFMGK
ncbi:MAG: TRAP transporter large permease subunit [Desulfobacteraceae bacterium]|nr:MAG: TRAP transporter large permease subunit [Desulfobacteraceae bacterium]